MAIDSDDEDEIGAYIYARSRTANERAQAQEETASTGQNAMKLESQYTRPATTDITKRDAIAQGVSLHRFNDKVRLRRIRYLLSQRVLTLRKLQQQQRWRQLALPLSSGQPLGELEHCQGQRPHRSMAALITCDSGSRHDRPPEISAARSGSVTAHNPDHHHDTNIAHQYFIDSDVARPVEQQSKECWDRGGKIQIQQKQQEMEGAAQHKARQGQWQRGGYTAQSNNICLDDTTNLDAMAAAQVLASEFRCSNIGSPPPQARQHDQNRMMLMVPNNHSAETWERTVAESSIATVKGGECTVHGIEEAKRTNQPCLIEECSNGANEDETACKGMAKRIRQCSFPGCSNRIVQGGRCISHGARRQKCSYPSCTKNVKQAGLCSTHGPARKRCEFEGCIKVAVKGGKCIAHGAKKKPCSECAARGERPKQAVIEGMCKRHHDEVKGVVKIRAPRGSRTKISHSKAENEHKMMTQG